MAKKTSGSAKPPAWKAELKSKLKELRRLEKRAFRPRHGRKDFYEYLNGVYNLCDWTDSGVSQRHEREVARLCDLNVRAGTIPIRIVIDATASSQERHVKSRWAQALQYALAKKTPPNHFKRFLDENGGVEACKRKMAALRKKKRSQMPWVRAWAKKSSRKTG
jgi:hypothetical protein